MSSRKPELLPDLIERPEWVEFLEESNLGVGGSSSRSLRLINGEGFSFSEKGFARELLGGTRTAPDGFGGGGGCFSTLK